MRRETEDYKRQLQHEIRAKLDQHKDWLQEMRQREREQKDSQDGEDEGYPRLSPPSLKADPKLLSGDKSGSKMGNRGKRWEQLYELNKVQKETREFMRKALADDKDEDPECTFQPKISEKSQQIVSQLRPDFMERNNMWLEQKKEKMRLKGSTKEDKEFIHCTFQPQLNQKRPDSASESNLVHLGIDKHLQRQEEARKEKARKEAALAGQQKKTVHDPSRLTIPKNPNLSAFTKPTKKSTRIITKDKIANFQGEELEHQIEEIMNDPSSLYLSNCSMHDAVMALHEKINSFEMQFD